MATESISFTNETEKQAAIDEFQGRGNGWRVKHINVNNIVGTDDPSTPPISPTVFQSRNAFVDSLAVSSNVTYTGIST